MRGHTADGHIAWWRRTWVRLAMSFVFVTTLPLVGIAIYTTRRHVQVVREVAASAAAERAASLARSLTHTLATARHDVLTVAEWPVLQSYLTTPASATDEFEFWRQKLIMQLRTFADLRPDYVNINYGDELRGAQIRVERRGTTIGVSMGGIEAAAVPWMGQAVQLLPRQVVVHTAVKDDALCVSVVARVRAPFPGPRQLVWIDMMWDSASASRLSPSGHVALYDSDGACLYPSECPHLGEISGTTAAFIRESGGRRELVSWADVGSVFSERWRLALFEPDDVLEAGARDFRQAFLGVLILAMAGALLLGVWLARQVTLPLRGLCEAARRIGTGDFDVALDVPPDDELGVLATQIAQMAHALQHAHEDFERQIQDKTEQLIRAERLAAIGRTAAAVAHEINNPSGVIAMYAQMLTEKLPPNDPMADKLRVIDDKAREIALIVEELRDYARGPAPMREWVDALALLEAGVHAADGPRRERPHIDVTLDVHPERSRLRVDPQQMTRVLRNLLVNAYHAMPEGGRVDIRCAPADDHGVMITVDDTGSGMTPEQLRQLFDPFFSTKRFGTGTGLGLAISKEIVERHGGSIRAESQEGAGTTITISFSNEDDSA